MPTQTLWNTFRHPVPQENRSNLRSHWSGLAPEQQVPRQMFGRQWEGCAATVGAMPKCDFSCTACYLGSEANRVPALTVAEIRAQLKLIRGWVGRWGNVQLTDGELTLRDEGEVIEIIRTARELELIPMLMTHGDSFRKDPQLLARLVKEGGLEEISLHVDTTQRGRTGYGVETEEAALHPIREELAEIVRRTRRETGRAIRAAATITVTRSNLNGVAAIVRWMMANSDVFRIISFQPVASVGRTRDDEGVTRHELWDQICQGLGESIDDEESTYNSSLLFGHGGCSHVVMGAGWRSRGGQTHFTPLRSPADAAYEASLFHFFERFGGLSFRSDRPLQAFVRGAGVLAGSPWFFLTKGTRWLRTWLGRSSRGSALRALASLFTGRAKLNVLTIASHHFMDLATLESEEGQEREAACVFRVPHKGELVSMCRMNAAGLRKEQYAAQLAPSADAEARPALIPRP